MESEKEVIKDEDFINIHADFGNFVGHREGHLWYIEIFTFTFDVLWSSQRTFLYMPFPFGQLRNDKMIPTCSV